MQRKNNKYDKNDPDNNIIKIIWAMEINHKSWSFSRESFDKIYSEQVPIKRMVYDTATNILIALFSTANQAFH